jgi:hypothetical protein
MVSFISRQWIPAALLVVVVHSLHACAQPKERIPASHIILPSRDVQVTLPFWPKDVHAVAQRSLADGLGYALTDSKFDEQSATGRLEGQADDQRTARVVIKPGRAYQSAIVQVFAVPAGARTGDAALAEAILTRIEDNLWSERGAR